MSSAMPPMELLLRGFLVKQLLHEALYSFANADVTNAIE